MRIAVLMLVGVVCMSPGAARAQSEAEVHKALRGALACAPDPIGTVQRLVDGGSRFEAGYATLALGEGTDLQSIVVLRTPVTIAGATATAVIAGGESAHPDFGGLVWARFSGDMRRVISELKLGAHRDLAGVTMGAYERQTGLGPDGKAEALCSMTIVLTPINNREFLLGCGWCPG